MWLDAEAGLGGINLGKPKESSSLAFSFPVGKLGSWATDVSQNFLSTVDHLFPSHAEASCWAKNAEYHWPKNAEYHWPSGSGSQVHLSILPQSYLRPGTVAASRLMPWLAWWQAQPVLPSPFAYW